MGLNRGIQNKLVNCTMIFTTIQILFTLNFTTPIIEVYDFDPNKICYVIHNSTVINQAFLCVDKIKPIFVYTNNGLNSVFESIIFIHEYG